jgi:hypothetical protein
MTHVLCLLQVTYPVTIPKEERTSEDEAKLKDLLDTVGIGYLVSRWAGDAEGATDGKLGWDCVARWVSSTAIHRRVCD